MLRRVGRWLCFVLGLAPLACIPLTFVGWGVISFDLPWDSSLFGLIEFGNLQLGVYPVELDERGLVQFTYYRHEYTEDEIPLFEFSYFYRGLDDCFIWVPLWVPAAICLAWPVTSFIIHRRRHKRGFPVEPKGTVNASDPEPQRGA